MAFVTAEVVADPHGSRTYLVICKSDGEVFASWPVRTEKEGEQQLVDALRGLAQKERNEVEFNARSR
jgi:hypothetical protein